MQRQLLLLMMIAALPACAFSQTFLEPFAGYQVGLNNQKNNSVNSGLQLAFKRNSSIEFLLQLQKSWPLPSGSNAPDSSFTLNTSLPLYAPAEKKLRSSSLLLAAGCRFVLAGKQSNNKLLATTYLGIKYQKTAVSYQYDKTNYTILNPDQTLSRTGLFVSAGLAYMRQLKTSRLLVELNVASPSAGSNKYPSSFKLTGQLSCNIGYSIQLSKN
ncbi:MAG: hypothetical protein ABIQ88_22640 [Chitinophagaceae bacterium]